MEERKVKVSIITPVYNAAEFLPDCLNSTLNQRFSDFEHILIDDLSTDGSRDIIQQYADTDARVKVLGLKGNSGAGVARNAGIEMARGQYIAFLDADDLWHPEKLERQLEFMKHTGASLSFTAYEHIDASGRPTGRVTRVPATLSYSKALYYNRIGCLTAMYDSRALGKQYMPSLRKRQDYALWLKILKMTEGHGLNEVLACYRNTPGSVSSGKLDLIRYQWQLYFEEEKLGVLKSAFYTGTSALKKVSDMLLHH